MDVSTVTVFVIDSFGIGRLNFGSIFAKSRSVPNIFFAVIDAHRVEGERG
jgi:hypothetical protein